MKGKVIKVFNNEKYNYCIVDKIISVMTEKSEHPYNVYLAENCDNESLDKLIVVYSCGEFYELFRGDSYVDNVVEHTYKFEMSFDKFIERKIAYERTIKWIYRHFNDIKNEYNKNVKWYNELVHENDRGISIEESNHGCIIVRRGKYDK